MAKRKKGRNTPQPPAPQSPAPTGGGDGGGGGGYYQYTPTVESQFNQPYQDLAVAGATSGLGDVIGRQGQQNQMADIYGQGAAGALGGAASGMNQLTGFGGQALGASGQFLGGAQAQMPGVASLGGQATGLGQGTLGQYGQLMNPNLNIQQNLANQIQAIQSGADKGFDPLLDQQLGDQERVMREQLRRQLGPDYENSSAGIEALGKFNQLRQTTLGTSRFNQLQGLMGQQQTGLGNIANQGLGFGGYGAGIQGQQFGQGMQGGQFAQGVQGQQFGQGAQLGQMYGQQTSDQYNQAMGLRNQQLGGAGQLLNNAGAQQQLYGNIPSMMGHFGTDMTGQAGAAVGAQQPFQTDRFGKFQASMTSGPTQYAGQMMGKSGDRWIQAAGSQSN